MRTTILAAAGLLTLVVPHGAAAQATPSERPTFDLTLYGWLQSIDGRVGAGPLTASVESSFSNTIDKSDSVVPFMGRVEGRSGGFGLFLDAAYVSLGFDRVSAGPFTARADSSLLVVDFGGTAELAASGDGLWVLDALAGGRVTSVRNEIAINGGPSADQRNSWFEPFVGMRMRGRFATNWDYAVQADVGGFGVGSDFAWQALATVGYRFSLLGKEATALAGYRALSQDYSDGGFRWDMTIHGPVLGVTLRF
ncbi:hypothetical protein [Falsiroseomonas sp. E2-1-a20]|uniref:hypothetical protein n=1 Tax=Falsiroseomonas sp. E2-1-a20 TaxID=3239300 RepID=UPI003F2D5CE2